jgi:hypothetical protein
MSKEDKAARSKLNRFLKELGELTERHGMKIGGCESCCGAPWVAQTGKRTSLLVEYLRYCTTCEKYGPRADHEDC